MKTNQDEDKSLSFVKRWIKAFYRILNVFGNREIPNNTAFIDTLLREEQTKAKNQEDIDILAEKRKLLEELCDDVDSYYEKKAAAEKAPNLENWFKDEISTFVQNTIPDATQEDVKEIEETLSKSMDTDIEVRAALLESEFSSEDIETSEDKPIKAKGDE